MASQTHVPRALAELNLVLLPAPAMICGVYLRVYYTCTSAIKSRVALLEVILDPGPSGSLVARQ